MEPPAHKRIRLERLKVQNFKVLDELEIEFPSPRMPGEPDVFVFGSKNGYGKTSLLESCALLYLAGGTSERVFESNSDNGTHSTVPDLFIRAGAKRAEVEGDLTVCGEPSQVRVTFDRSGESSLDPGTGSLADLFLQREVNPAANWEERVASLIGADADPLFLPGLIFMHSYRKVQEGNPALGHMASEDHSGRLDPYDYRRRKETAASLFKMTVLRSMMANAGLFEVGLAERSQEVLAGLNELVRNYAGGALGKLRPLPGNTVDLRVTPVAGGESFAFDSLSSGQKEIISTLFLVWYYSKEQPGIVLIDEPELHLNAEWQRDFIQQIHKLAPWNQYIIATHSEDVFASVPEERRFLLSAGKAITE